MLRPVLATLCLQCAAAYLLREVEVPRYAFAGDNVTISCAYVLLATRLYSLKWYHNETEFYRYVPTERNGPVTIKPNEKFIVTEQYRSERRVTLSLARVSVLASGQYRCEVMAEHPSFRTEAATATMTVLRDPLAPPELVGGREIYEPAEVIKVGCQVRRWPPHAPHPALHWFLDGEKASEESTSGYGDTAPHGHLGLALHVPGEQILSAGGVVRAECRVSLGGHSSSSFKTLRVRRRRISYIDTYYRSTATDVMASDATTFLVTQVVLLLLLLREWTK